MVNELARWKLGPPKSEIEAAKKRLSALGLHFTKEQILWACRFNDGEAWKHKQEERVSFGFRPGGMFVSTGNTKPPAKGKKN